MTLQDGRHDNLVVVYVTMPSRQVAQDIATVLVEEKLVACANIMPAMTSVYRWNEAIEQTDEVPVLLKTRAALFDSVAARIKALHPYEIPCIEALPVGQASPDFASWVCVQTSNDAVQET